MIQLRAGFSMEPNERTPAIKRQSQCKAPHQQASHPHACQGIAGRGDEPNVWDRKCWRVKRGRSQPWTKAPRAEARRFPVNCSGPGHERTGGSRRGGGGWRYRSSVSPCSPLGRRGRGCVLLAWNHDRGRPGTPDPGSAASLGLCSQPQALPRDPDMRLNISAHRNTPTSLSALKTQFHPNTTLSLKVAEVKHITFFL